MDLFFILWIFIGMKTKLIISESQYERLKVRLNEETIHNALVKELKGFLTQNYTVTQKFMREGGEYKEMPMLEIKADGELITFERLCEYLKVKYENVIKNHEFIEQVIKDWVDNKITDDNLLSKPVLPM